MFNSQNNPFMDMFKQSMETPMNMWNQALEMTKNNDFMKSFCPTNFMGSSKITDHLPWMKHFGFFQEHHAHKAFDFGKHMEGMEAFSELSNLALENSQAMMHRQGEIIQRHANELYKAMQEIATSHDPANSVEAQQEYMRVSFEALVSDFKELAEMYAKASIEGFGAASEKMKHHFHCHKDCEGHKHHAHSHEHHKEHHHRESTDSKKHAPKKK